MAGSPTFFAGGSTPNLSDTSWFILQRILGALKDGGGGGGGAQNQTGNGSPEGVVTPTYTGNFYTDLDAPYGVWYAVGPTNADWQRLL